MGSIRVETLIHAPIERCFDLARSVDAHLASTAGSQERVVAGRAHGLLELGDSVSWEAKHLGRRWRQGATITRLEAPYLFVDESTRGPLRSLHHLHQFTREGTSTLMVDTFDYELPAGLVGKIADRLVVERHLRRFLRERAGFLKSEAERSGGGDRT